MSDVVIDDEAVLWSAGPRDRADRPLLVLLHGYGSTEGDLFQLGTSLPLEPVIASLRAPLAAQWPLMGWAWYPLQGDFLPVAAEVDAAATAVLDWISRLEVQPTSIGLLGFSQGASVVLQLLRSSPDRFAYAVSLAGFVASRDHDGDEALALAAPPVFWGRGTLDTVIPAEAVRQTGEWLPAHTTLTGRIYEGLAHAVSPQELADVSAFIRRTA
ncbi:phospholipase/carboxylesterase [Labedella gwakjiensis]|uniref:Phospholipase n=1 Tax=Labedella gwakjiensis TaxID=390269 RepID=A0A2P8GS77_9MICO|nr:alpha/beta hydrolase-fold protein [Labedella gwakjiensis]PSL36805.1 phospholipase/carboxylesterase [Labedella gwakjiensis]RUQ84315.1 phospholipase [Labedella gwakjiensis]